MISIKLFKSFLFFVVLLLSSCAIKRGMEKNFQSEVIDEEKTNFRTGHVWVRAFQHKTIGSITTMESTYGSGLAVGKDYREQPSRVVMSAIRNSGIFESVAPIETEKPHDFILEGAIAADWTTPWWTWVQFIDIAIHAWFFPTLGRDLECSVEINVYDPNYEPVYITTVDYKKKYLCTVWWGMTHGGSYDYGTDVEVQKEVLDYAFSQIKNDLQLALKEYIETHPEMAMQ